MDGTGDLAMTRAPPRHVRASPGLSLLLVLALIAAACGDDGGGRSAAEQALVDAIAADFLADEEPDSPVGEEEANCYAGAVVDEFGVAGLMELGITAENVASDDPFAGATDEQIDTLIDATFACIDFGELFVQGIVEGAAEDGVDLSTSSAECLGNEMGSEEFLRPLLADEIRGNSPEFGEDPESAAAIFEAFVECLSAEELASLIES